MKNLDEINKDILEKIDSMDIEKNIKDFLKEAYMRNTLIGMRIILYRTREVVIMSN